MIHKKSSSKLRHKKAFDDSVTSPAYGIKQGAFAVDQNGQATYNLPIDLPPGIVGLQPNLAISYQHRGANNILGVGWGLSGLSAISRTKATYASDNFNGSINYDSNDRYSLDGQRLINIQGAYGAADTVYLTEVNSWKQVVAGNNCYGGTESDGFTVYMKNGFIYSYGTTPDSVIFADGSSPNSNTEQNVRLWALASIKDLNGNTVNFKYITNTTDPSTCEPGAYYISQIIYNQTSILFSYTDRKDNMLTYLGGYQIQTNKLLSDISVSLTTPSGTELIKTYSFNYQLGYATGFSQLSSIDVIGTDNTTTPPLSIALPPITFQWQDGLPNLDFNQEPSPLENSYQPLQTLSLDINGNGKTDVVQIYSYNQTIMAGIYVATTGENGNISYSQLNPQDFVLNNYSQGAYQVLIGDLNGDGRSDLIVAYQDRGNNNNLSIDAFISNGTGFDPVITILTENPWNGQSSCGFFAVDASGNGCTDLVEGFSDASNGNNLGFFAYLSAFNQGAGFSPGVYIPTESSCPSSDGNLWAIDINGDGMVDMVLVDMYQSSLWTTSFITTDAPGSLNIFNGGKGVECNLNVSNQSQQLLLPSDANGDGVVDIIQIYYTNQTVIINSFLSNGIGGFAAAIESSIPDLPNINSNAFYPMGFNGGSQTCLVNCNSYNGSLNFYMFASQSDGKFILITPPPTNIPINNINFLVGDANGDGKADLLYYYIFGGQNYIQPFPSANLYPDLLNSITDQLGGTTSITYEPISNPSVYAETSEFALPDNCTRALRYTNHLSPSQFPVQDVVGRAIYVVSGYTFSNNKGSTKNNSWNRFEYSHAYEMTYTDACIDLSGRGWLGFETVTSTDLNTGLQSVRTFNQVFPFTGTVASAQLNGVGVASSADPNVSYDPNIPLGSTLQLSNSLNTYQSVYPVANNASVYEVQTTGNLSYNYTYGTFDYLIAKSFVYDQYSNRTIDIWHGYIDYMDPVPSIGPFPIISPQATEQNVTVYTYRQFQNVFTTYGSPWVLGLVLVEKQSENSSETPDQYSTFQIGDFNLKTKAYYSGNYNLYTESDWFESGNASGFLTTQYTYDSFGNRLTETIPGGSTTTYSYDTFYNTYLQSTQSPESEWGPSLVTNHGFDARFGIKVGYQDENEFIFITAVDVFGRKMAKQGPVPAGSLQNDPNLVGNFVSGVAKFQLANVVTLESLTYADDAEGGIYVEQNLLQNFSSDISTDSVWKRSYIDGLGRECQTATDTGLTDFAVVLTNYDFCSKVATTTSPFFSSTNLNPQAPAGTTSTYTYDVLSRPLQATSPGGEDGISNPVTNKWQYDPGEVVISIEAAGSSNPSVSYEQKITSKYFNGASKQIESVVVSDSNATTVFQFDGIGRILTTIDPQNIANTIVYDTLNRKVSLDNPDQNTRGESNFFASGYLYDPSTGWLLQKADASGQIVTYQYDKLGRVISQYYSADNRVFQFEYDNMENNAMGKLASVVIVNSDAQIESSRNFQYDSYGNITTEILTILGIDFSLITTSVFDPQKRVVSKTFPDNTNLQRTFQSGRLVSQSLDGASVNYPLEEYNPMGQVGQVQYGANTLTATYTRNPVGQIWAESLLGPNQSPLLSYSYSYDQLNQLLSSTESIYNRQELFSYTNKRLTKAQVPGFALDNSSYGTYEYTSAGNFTSKDGNDYAYGNNNHYPTSIGTNYTAEQDYCGRTHSVHANSHTTDYTYDGTSAISSIMVDGDLIRSYISDDTGQRIKETQRDGTIILYVNSSFRYTILAGAVGISITKFIRDSSGTVAEITDGNGGASNILYYRCDLKKNVTHSFDSNGILQGFTIYDGFGLPFSVTESSSFAVNYEGKYWDGVTGLHYFNSRYYSPSTGVFYTPDTHLGGRSHLQQDVWNRFAFELNNPINHNDPDGHNAVFVAGIAIGVAALAIGIIICVLTAGIGTAAVAPAEAGIDAAIEGSVAAAEVTAVTTTQASYGTTFLIGASSGAMFGAGSSAIGYSVTHTHNFSWAAFGKTVGIGAATGLVSGGVLGPLNAATSAIESVALKTFLNVLGGTVMGSGMDMASTVLNNLASGENPTHGLGWSALFGGITGGVVGGISTGINEHFNDSDLSESAKLSEFANFKARTSIYSDLNYESNIGELRSNAMKLFVSANNSVRTGAALNGLTNGLFGPLDSSVESKVEG